MQISQRFNGSNMPLEAVYVPTRPLPSYVRRARTANLIVEVTVPSLWVSVVLEAHLAVTHTWNPLKRIIPLGPPLRLRRRDNDAAADVVVIIIAGTVGHTFPPAAAPAWSTRVAVPAVSPTVRRVPAMDLQWHRRGDRGNHELFLKHAPVCRVASDVVQAKPGAPGP